MPATGSTPLHLAAKGGYFNICENLLNVGAQFTKQNNYGDTFLHIGIRNDHQSFVVDILTYFENRKDLLLTNDELGKQYPLDIENDQEKCTPYMLAVLRELFEVADLMQDLKLANIAHKNKDGESVFDIVNRLKIKTLQKYLVEAASRKKNVKAAKPQPAAAPQRNQPSAMKKNPSSEELKNPSAPDRSILDGNMKSNPQKVANDAKELLE